MSRRHYGTGVSEVDGAAILVIGALIIVGGVVVGVGVGCYYAGKGAWWLGKKTAHAISDANDERKLKNQSARDLKAFSENMDQKSERRKLKQKVLAVQPKLPIEFAEISPEETARHCGVVTLRFGSANNLKNLDTIGLSDPYAKIYFCDFEVTKVHYSKTYTIQESLNPVWYQEDITIHYFPGMILLLKIFDEDPGRDELEGIVRIPLSDLFITSPPGGEFKEATFDLTVDDSHLRGNSMSQLVSPHGISKKNVRGTVTFSFAYISDELMKAQGMDHL